MPVSLRMKLSYLLKRFWLFGPSLGLIIAILATLTFTLWDWIENPSGIFHDSTGTNWNFVYDTAVSWFFPTFLQSTLILSVAHLLVSGILLGFHKYWRAKRK